MCSYLFLLLHQCLACRLFCFLLELPVNVHNYVIHSRMSTACFTFRNKSRFVLKQHSILKPEQTHLFRVWWFISTLWNSQFSFFLSKKKFHPHRFAFMLTTKQGGRSEWAACALSLFWLGVGSGSVLVGLILKAILPLVPVEQSLQDGRQTVLS